MRNEKVSKIRNRTRLQYPPSSCTFPTQSSVTLSTTEAEYVSTVSAGQETIWFWNLFTEFGYSQTCPSPLLMGNQSAISVARNPDHHGQVKHLDLCFYWLCD